MLWFHVSLDQQDIGCFRLSCGLFYFLKLHIFIHMYVYVSLDHLLQTGSFLSGSSGVTSIDHSRKLTS